MLLASGSLHFGATISGMQSGMVLIAADSANPVTIQTIRYEYEAEKELTIECGAQTLAVGHFDSYPLDILQQVCTDDVTIEKPDVEDVFISIGYLPFNINETGGEVVPTAIPFTLLHSVTFGELTLALILIPLVLVVTYQTIIAAFRKPIVRHK